MRFAFGIIVGILVTIGLAYAADTYRSAPGLDGKDRPRMVNWAVVGDNVRSLSSDIQGAWGRLVGGAKQIEKSTRS